MMTQTFRARTLADAQQAAYDALGVEVEVVTTRCVPRPGLRGLLGAKDVEIAVAPVPPSSAPPRRGPFAAAAYASEGSTPDVTALRAELRHELRSIQSMVLRTSGAAPSVESDIAALRAAVERLSEPDQPRSGPLGRILRQTGLEGKAAAALAQKLGKNGRAPSPEALRDALADLIQVTQSPLLESGPALIALVGPTGVGKTTTAAKLAARAIQDLNRSVTLISCDTIRVGAMQQIERFADLLEVRLVAARSGADLARAIVAADTDLVIVDTAGRGPRADSPERTLGAPGMENRGKTLRSRCVLLCLPAALRAADAAHFAKVFAATRPTALAITKLDETRTPAGLVHGAVATGLPVSLLGFGQRVPEDIAPATRGAILDYLLPRAAARRPT